MNGRKSVTWEQKLALDLYYADNVTFGLDLKIILQTVINVLKRKDVGVASSGTVHFSKFRESQWAAEGRNDLIEEAREKAKPFWNLTNTK